MSGALKIEASLDAGGRTGTAHIAEHARKLERLGFDRIFSTEGRRDPFLLLAVAADHTHALELGTSIAVAFARNPMNIAVAAHEMNLLSGGRFRLGLGSQIRPHITRRFGMPWHGAAKQMREFIGAVKVIWDSWWDGTSPRFEGEFYDYSLMTPEFTPVTEGLVRPPILLAAVGPLMVQTAAEVADGLIVHPFCTEQYLREVIIPGVEPALAARGRSLDDFEIHYPIFMATGRDEPELEHAKATVRAQIGYCASTPAYRRVLDLHGWGDLQPRLRQLTKENKWDRLGELISDEVLETFAAVGEPVEAAAIVHDRVAGVVGSVALDSTIPEDVLKEQMAILRQT